MEDEKVKILSIDDLLIQLDGNLKKLDSEGWNSTINKILDPPTKARVYLRGFVAGILKKVELDFLLNDGKGGLYKKLSEYESLASKINKSLGDKFKEWEHLILGNFDTSPGYGIYNIVRLIGVNLNIPASSFNSLQKDIDNLKERIKFDKLSGKDAKRIKNVFEEQDVKTATYNYLAKKLGDYIPMLKDFISSMDELNKKAESLRIYLTLKPHWFERKTGWNEGLKERLKPFEDKYKEAENKYRQLLSLTSNFALGDKYKYVFSPIEIKDIPELYKIKQELEGRDPKPNFKFETVGKGEYKISMWSTCGSPHYGIDNISLNLKGLYEVEQGVNPNVDIDLTKPRQGGLFVNEVLRTGSDELVVKLKVNLPENTPFKFLDVSASYELPCFKQRIELHTQSLVHNSVVLN